MKTTEKRKSGGSRLKEAHKSLIWVTPTEDEKEMIRVAAAYQKKPMSQFLLSVGLAAAAKIIARKSPICY